MPGRWSRGFLVAGLLAVAGAGCGGPITVRSARQRQQAPSPTQGAAAPAPALLRDLALDAGTLPQPRRQVVEVALAMAGASAAGRDCSSFMVDVYANAGLPLPRTVAEQLRVGSPVEPAALAPGDLVFFAFASGPADHVGLYAGRDAFVHVSSSNRRVQLDSLQDPDFARAHVGYRRVLR